MSKLRAVVSTPLDSDVLERLDAFCAKVHRNRAEVMRGLLYALLVEDKQFIYEEWRKEILGTVPS